LDAKLLYDDAACLAVDSVGEKPLDILVKLRKTTNARKTADTAGRLVGRLRFLDAIVILR